MDQDYEIEIDENNELLGEAMGYVPPPSKEEFGATLMRARLQGVISKDAYKEIKMQLEND